MCRGYVAKCANPACDGLEWRNHATGAPVMWQSFCAAVLAGGAGPWQKRCELAGGPEVVIAPVAVVPTGEDGSLICAECQSDGYRDVVVPEDVGDGFAWALPAAAAAANLAAATREKKKRAARSLRQSLITDWLRPSSVAREPPGPVPDPEGSIGERAAALVATYLGVLKEDRVKSRRSGRVI